MNYFVTGIGTDAGKTVVSAILCSLLQADYWKPIQAGAPRDADVVAALSPATRIHPEKYLLHTPFSPHHAAFLDNVNLCWEDVELPTSRPLVIEGAGGCLVPINHHEFIIDFVKKFPCEIILVSNLYLGSINHTLLTLHYLHQQRLPVKGIIFNGDCTPSSESIIENYSPYPILMRIEKEAELTPHTIKKYAQRLKQHWP